VPKLRCYLLIAILICSVQTARGQIPPLPDGAETRWIIDDPAEVVTYAVFDTDTVADRLPTRLRFLTVRELSERGVGWARTYLRENPSHANWGVSFLEIVRAGIFEIDGRSPNWLENGAAALWSARVESVDPRDRTSSSQTWLLLDFWISDSIYATYMIEKGYFAEYADVRLRSDSTAVTGSIVLPDLQVECNCTPQYQGAGAGSPAVQTFFPPRQSELSTITRVSFAGHRICECAEDNAWRISGTHPLAQAIPVERALFEYGYQLLGGTYLR